MLHVTGMSIKCIKVEDYIDHLKEINETLQSS